jgi:hypothetical protein
VTELISKSVRQLLIFGRELLLIETGSSSRGYFGNPEEGKRPPLKAATQQRLLKTGLWALECVCVIANVKCNHALCIKKLNKSNY